MKKLLHKMMAKITGKNPKSMPKEMIIDQMNEPRPLPMGRKEFDGWSRRIISGALVPGSEGEVCTMSGYMEWKLDSKERIHYESQQFALSNMLMHLGPTESHKPDAYFIHCLRKFAINQVADTVRKELHEAAKARTAAEEAKKAESSQETSAP